MWGFLDKKGGLQGIVIKGICIYGIEQGSGVLIT